MYVCMYACFLFFFFHNLKLEFMKNKKNKKKCLLLFIYFYKAHLLTRLYPCKQTVDNTVLVENVSIIDHPRNPHKS